MEPIVKQLAAKIEADLGIRCIPKTFRRTYHGHPEFIWTMQTVKGGVVGSLFTAAECVRGLCLGTNCRDGEIEIFPYG